MFSWLTGGSKGGDQNGAAAPPPTGSGASAPLPPSGSSVPPSLEAIGSTAGNTDATETMNVLERIVKAADALKGYDKANELMDLARQQEGTWQEKFRADAAAAEAKRIEEQAKVAQVVEEERRRTMQFETQERVKRTQEEDRIARQRYEDQLRQQAQLNEQERQRQQDVAMRQENERRKTMEYEAQLRRKTELAKAQVDAEARIKQERENRDIRDAQLVLQAEEGRKTTLAAIEAYGQEMRQMARDYASDPKNVALTIGAVTGLALGVYAARAGTNVAGQYLQRRLSQPPLIRETSRQPFILNPWGSIKRMLSSKKGNPLEGMVLNEKTEKSLGSITVATANTKANGAAFRHLLLYGPPGTGKTMFGRRLAQQSGLEYAVLAGGDVGPLGKDAVTELHRVFDWAESSKRGVLVFIDEADAFLRKRGETGDGKMSEEMRNALSTFLYRTGSPTDKFMLVFSSNEPAAFDRAVTDRVDEVVELGLPSESERQRLIELYFKEYVTECKQGRPIAVHEDVAAFNFAELAGRLSGFSGRQIAKLCSAFQAAAHSSRTNMLTKDMMQEIVEDHLQQLAIKDKWSHMKIH